MKVSVALCTYNGDLYIREQLDSILSQSLKVDEIVVCDDLSSDNTIGIISELSKENPGVFKIYINQSRLGSIKNFEKAIQLCKGDYIFLSDQDDVWSFEKVKTILSCFNNNLDIKVIATNGNYYNGERIIEDRLSVWDIPIEIKKQNIIPNYFEIISSLTNIATGATMAIRKDFKNYIFDLPLVHDFHHDEWIALIASKNKQFMFIDEKLINYRIHGNQQVGINFFEMNNNDFNYLLRPYKIGKTFGDYKHLLKLISKRYKRNLSALKFLYDNQDAKNLLLESIKMNKEFFLKFNTEFKNKYPVKSFFLSIIDKITNKRTLNIK